MADRSAAEIFGNTFDILAKNPTDEIKEIAKEIYKLSYNYDFTQCQM